MLMSKGVPAESVYSLIDCFDIRLDDERSNIAFG